MKPKVSVLIPAYNEATQIRETVTAAKAIPEVDEVVVVDDGSTDSTDVEAIRAGAFVIELEKNRGKGGAVQAGLRYVHGDVVLLLDGDLGHSARYGRDLLGPILNGQADLVIGAFPNHGTKSGFGLVEGFGRAIIRLLGGIDAQSPLSGQRAVRRDVLDGLNGIAPGFGMEVAMTVGALRRGFAVREVEVPFTHSKTGKDLPGFKHRLKQLIHIFWATVRLLAESRGTLQPVLKPTPVVETAQPRPVFKSSPVLQSTASCVSEDTSSNLAAAEEEPSCS